MAARVFSTNAGNIEIRWRERMHNFFYFSPIEIEQNATSNDDDDYRSGAVVQ